MISVICLWLILTRLNIVKPSFHSVFAAPEYLCDILNFDDCCFILHDVDVALTCFCGFETKNKQIIGVNRGGNLAKTTMKFALWKL